MAELPDLDTSEIGSIAYWNALDHGASSVNPTEMLDHPDIVDFVAFDNGFDLNVTYTQTTYNLEFNVRLKTDGWIVVWIDGPNIYGRADLGDDVHKNAASALLWDWTRNDAVATFDSSPPSHLIQELVGYLSNSGSITFNHADVGHYLYNFPDATTAEYHAENIGNSQRFSCAIGHGGDIDFDAWMSLSSHNHLHRSGYTAHYLEGTRIGRGRNNRISSYNILDLNLPADTLHNHSTAYSGTYNGDPCGDVLGYLFLY